MTTINLSAQTEINSTSYVDELGISIGLTRLPGESSSQYLKRLKSASKIDTGQDYRGLLNSISLQLGLSTYKAISLTASNPITVTCSVSGIVLTQGSSTQTIPIVLVDIDNAWTWYMLSEVVSTINSGTIAHASLLVTDAPALVLANQSNIITVISQPISGQNINLGKTGIIVGSEVFNNPVSSYSINSNGNIYFQSAIPGSTTISYNYQIWPYSLIGGDVSLISLLDPNLPNVAVCSDGSLVYQLQEVTQAVMAIDQSYWG